MKTSEGGSPMTTQICGIDIGKTVFHLVGLSKEGHIVAKKRFSRKQLLTYTVNLPACLIGIEACAGAHFLARALSPRTQRQAHARGVCSAIRQVQQERLCRCRSDC